MGRMKMGGTIPGGTRRLYIVPLRGNGMWGWARGHRIEREKRKGKLGVNLRIKRTKGESKIKKGIVHVNSRHPLTYPPLSAVFASMDDERPLMDFVEKDGEKNDSSY
jgi:hypothetical protein